MNAVVDSATCIGCGLCIDTCPEVFEMAGDVARAKVSPVPFVHLDACREAAEVCPVDAIELEE